jgi:hypothetical protein
MALLHCCHLQIQRPIDRLRKTATAIASGLALIHLGMFVMMYMMLNQQMQLVRVWVCLQLLIQCSPSPWYFTPHSL